MAVIYIPEVNLKLFRPYERAIYTIISAIHLGSFPVTLVMTFAPLGSPWRQVVCPLYIDHIALIILLHLRDVASIFCTQPLSLGYLFW